MNSTPSTSSTVPAQVSGASIQANGQRVIEVQTVINKVQTFLDYCVATQPATLSVVPTWRDLLVSLRNGRSSLLKQLLETDASVIREVIKSPIFHGTNLSELLHYENDPAEQNLVQMASQAFTKGWKAPFSTNILAIVMLYRQAFEFPLITDDLDGLEEKSRSAYFAFCMKEPVLVRPSDAEKYANHLIQFMDWCAQKIRGKGNPEWVHTSLIPLIISNLSVRGIASMGLNLLPMMQARARLIEALYAFMCGQTPHLPVEYKPVLRPVTGRKIRIGYMLDVIGERPDNVALLAEIEAYNPDVIEVYLYAADIYAPTFRLSKADFYRRLFAKTTEVRSLFNADAQTFVDLVRKDELDVLVLHDGSYAGFGGYDLALAERLAPVQILHGRVNPVSSALDNFDYYIAPKIPAHLLPEIQRQASEKLVLPSGSLWPCHNKIATIEQTISRQSLELSEDDVVLLTVAPNPKLATEMCDAYARILKEQPTAKLLFATLNPPWEVDKTLSGIVLNLSEGMKRAGIVPDRVVLLNKLEHSAILQMFNIADIFLCPWYMDSAVWIQNALAAGMPVVAKDADCLQNVAGQSVLRQVGLGEFVAETADAYVRVAGDLISDKHKRMALRTRIVSAYNDMASNGAACFSVEMQGIYVALVKEAAARYAENNG